MVAYESIRYHFFHISMKKIIYHELKICPNEDVEGMYISLLPSDVFVDAVVRQSGDIIALLFLREENNNESPTGMVGVLASVVYPRIDGGCEIIPEGYKHLKTVAFTIASHNDHGDMVHIFIQEHWGEHKQADVKVERGQFDEKSARKMMV